MATKQDIDDAIQKLDEKWRNPEVRNELFGNAIKSVSIQNIRGINATIEFSWPVCVIGGINGSGKTTILQICSCAFVQEHDGHRIFKLGDWVRSAMQGETSPIGNPASVSFSFWDVTPRFEIPYKPQSKRWGYPRRRNPRRNSYFVGISHFGPRIERNDRTLVFRSQLVIRNSENIDPRVLESICRILQINYEEAKYHTVGIPTGNWTEKIPQLKRDAASYTEAHMGAGEQKVVRLVTALESLSNRSLVLLEEPELNLHPDAQRGLAWYLMSLCRRKGHQVLIATHSPYLYEALPRQARILLIRNIAALQVLNNSLYLDCARQLDSSIKANKCLILVEDDVAKSFLLELLRRFDRKFLDQSCIVPIGNNDDVARIVGKFNQNGVNAVGVRDPDTGEYQGANLFSFPGNMAIESILIEEGNLNSVAAFISDIKPAFDRAKAQGAGYDGSKKDKKILEALSGELSIEPHFLNDRLILAWLNNHNEEARTLVGNIKAGLGLT